MWCSRNAFFFSILAGFFFEKDVEQFKTKERNNSTVKDALGAQDKCDCSRGRTLFFHALESAD